MVEPNGRSSLQTLALIPFEKRTLGDLVRDGERESPDHRVLQIDGVDLDWGEIGRRSAELAAGLSSLGVGRGEVVCQMAGNTIGHVATVFALARLGAIECPVNTALRGPMLTHVLGHSRARVLIVEQAFVDQVLPELADLGGIETVVIRGDEAPPIPGRRVVVEEDLPSGSLREEPVIPSDPATLIYTSGTTGPAKGVLHVHHFAFANAAIKIANWRLTLDDVLFSALPLFHANARYSTLLTACILNARAVIVARFSASRFWQQIQESGATEVGTVGTLAPILLERPPNPLERAHSVRMVHGAGALPPDRRAEFERRFGVRLVTGFAMTETSHIATTSPDDPGRYRAAGRPVDAFDVAILDENDTPLPPEEVGEIAVRPRVPYGMFSEYFRDAAATTKALTNLWFHTGDLGFIDVDGYLHWVDRRKDAIRRRGEMISSQEVEHVLSSHPRILEAAAVGVPGELGEEEVLALIRATGEGVSLGELIAYGSSRLPGFAVPRYYEFVDDFPRTSTSKIDKAALRTRGVTGDTHDAGSPRTSKPRV